MPVPVVQEVFSVFKYLIASHSSQVKVSPFLAGLTHPVIPESVQPSFSRKYFPLQVLHLSLAEYSEHPVIVVFCSHADPVKK